MMRYLRNLIKRAYITLTNDDSGQFSVTQVNSLDKTMPAEAIYPYGLYAQAPVNCLALIMSIQNDEGNLVAIPYGSQIRIKGLKSGEVAVGNVVSKAYIKFDESGNIIINSLTNGKTTVNTDLNVSGSHLTNLGSGGQPIARKGDIIKVNIGGTDYFGTIETGGQNTSI